LISRGFIKYRRNFLVIKEEIFFCISFSTCGILKEQLTLGMMCRKGGFYEKEACMPYGNVLYVFVSDGVCLWRRYGE
jgi:hypothetical protein